MQDEYTSNDFICDEDAIRNQAMDWLKKRGITQKVIDAFSVSVADNPALRLSNAITIPIRHIDGEFSFNKYRRNPLEGDVKPKYLYDRGGKVTLYGADKLVADYPTYSGETLAAKDGFTIKTEPITPRVVITEGELDTLVCWSLNIPAVSSTGGAMSFQEEWVELLKNYEVYICFDNDEAGYKGAIKVLEYLPEAKVVIVPHDLGTKDISDFVGKGGDFHALLNNAYSIEDIDDAKEQEEKLSADWRVDSAKFFQMYIEHHKVAAPSALPSDTTGKANLPKGGDAMLERAKAVDCRTLLPFKGAGKHPKTACLWHNDSDPSLTYYPRENNTYCFPCGKYADSIDIYMKLNNLSGKAGFKKAVKGLNNK